MVKYGRIPGKTGGLTGMDMGKTVATSVLYGLYNQIIFVFDFNSLI